MNRGAEFQGGNLGRLSGGDPAKHEEDGVDRGIDPRSVAQHIEAKVSDAVYKSHHCLLCFFPKFPTSEPP